MMVLVVIQATVYCTEVAAVMTLGCEFYLLAQAQIKMESYVQEKDKK